MHNKNVIRDIKEQFIMRKESTYQTNNNYKYICT